MFVLGLMSGTSADGVDAALVEFKGNPDKPRWELINTAFVEYPSDIRSFIVNASQGTPFSSQEWLALSEGISEINAHIAQCCDPGGDAEIIGCHGQTVCHKPPNGPNRGASLQLLQAPLLATLLDRPVVYDFRSKDLALGGHGAPLAPLLDEALLGRVDGWRAVLNLGGIANISLIPPQRGPERNHHVLGWDCGPSNSLIDFSVQKISQGEFNFDRDGLIASKGSPDVIAIERWLKEPFFQLSAPKSTGREQFGLLDLETRFNELQPIAPEDFVSTVTTFSAAVIAHDLENLYLQKRIRPLELLVAGGGAKNPVLLKELVHRCLGIRVFTTTEIGMPVDAREAISFALLAWWNALAKRSCLTNITGASRSSVLGIRVNPD